MKDVKKWISLLTCVACTFSSVHAEEAPIPPVEEVLAVSPELADDAPSHMPDDGKKQVGEAANDGSKTAGSGAGKYVLAACAIAVGIAALLLVSRGHGHHKHHKRSH
jgi:hypothetical protein